MQLSRLMGKNDFRSAGWSLLVICLEHFAVEWIRLKPETLVYVRLSLKKIHHLRNGIFMCCRSRDELLCDGCRDKSKLCLMETISSSGIDTLVIWRRIQMKVRIKSTAFSFIPMLRVHNSREAKAPEGLLWKTFQHGPQAYCFWRREERISVSLDWFWKPLQKTLDVFAGRMASRLTSL